jgi:hypothetical protein
MIPLRLSVAAPSPRCWRRREQPGNKPHRRYLSYEIRDWCRKATPPSPRCIAGHRRREHPRPSRPAAKRAAREVLPRCLRSTVYRVQPRPPFLRGSRRDTFALRPGSWASIASSFPTSLTQPDLRWVCATAPAAWRSSPPSAAPRRS